MLNFYIVRHGQTQWNTERRFQGWLDSPLTETGIQRAEALKMNLQHIDFDAYFTSPSPRASKTMALIAKEPGVVRQDIRLREIMLGNWQGMTHDDIEVLYPEQLALFYNQPELFELHEAETYHDVHARVVSFIESIKAEFDRENEEKNILIVTHGVTLMVFQLIFDGAEVSELTRYSVAKNAQVHHYHYENGMFTCINSES